MAEVDIARLVPLMLAADEANRNEFLRFVRAALDAVPPPKSAQDVFIGLAHPDASWLDEFEELPEKGADPQEALATAMRALQGVMRWHSESSLHNVTPPVLLPAVAAHAVTTLFNPNALWDLVSGGVLPMERQIVRQMSHLIGWKPDDADGLFTFGGKAGLMYGIRMGLNRCHGNVSQTGLAGLPKAYVLTTDQNHYSIRSSCALMGLGQQGVVEVATLAGEMDPQALDRAAREILDSGGVIAAVVLCGGNTLDAVVDPLQAVAVALDTIAVDYGMERRPWIHFDLPLGWPWLAFSRYDFTGNPLRLSNVAAATAAGLARKLQDADLADSTCFDFHKLGLVPYASSLFLTRHWRELRSVVGEPEPDEAWRPSGGNMRQHHSIEHSRSGAAITAVWTALQTLGLDGLRTYLGHLHEMVDVMRTLLTPPDFAVVNAKSPSLATLVVPCRADSPAASEDHGAAQNAYTESLFRYIAGVDGKTEEPLAIGYVPGYLPLAGGARLSVLRLYAANPVLTADSVRLAVARLRAMKKAFDSGDSAAPGVAEHYRLEHVPK